MDQRKLWINILILKKNSTVIATVREKITRKERTKIAGGKRYYYWYDYPGYATAMKFNENLLYNYYCYCYNYMYGITVRPLTQHTLIPPTEPIY